MFHPSGNLFSGSFQSQQKLLKVKYLGVLLIASLKDDDDDIQRQVKSLYCAANKLSGTFAQYSPAVKAFSSVSTACQCMLANCGANTYRLAWSAYVLRTTMLTELCVTYPEIQVLVAHTKSTIMSGHLMRCLETICIAFHNFVHLHLIFYPNASNAWCLLQILVFLHCLTLLYDSDQLQ